MGLSTQSDNSKLPRFYPTSFVNPYSNTSIFRIDVLLTNSVLDEDFFLIKYCQHRMSCITIQSHKEHYAVKRKERWKNYTKNQTVPEDIKEETLQQQ